MKPGYITLTRKPSNKSSEWRIASHPNPFTLPQKIPIAKIRCKFSRLGFLVPTWSITISAAILEGHFEGKCPDYSDTCNPEETGLSRIPVS
jgi:hypothetical protein